MGKNNLFNGLLKKFNLGLYCAFPRSAIEFIKENSFGKSLIGAEIGVFEGDNAYSIMKTLPMTHLFLIDPYKSYEGYEPAKLHGNKEELKARKKLSKFSEKITFIKEMSSEALEYVPGELDFVYIDGNHEYTYVLDDMRNYYGKLKKGGILAGHDIQNGFIKNHDGVASAFVDFVKEKNLKPYIWAPDWWVIKK